MKKQNRNEIYPFIHSFIIRRNHHDIIFAIKMLLSLILRFFYIIITLIIIVYVKSVEQFDVEHYLDPFDSQ